MMLCRLRGLRKNHANGILLYRIDAVNLLCDDIRGSFFYIFGEKNIKIQRIDIKVSKVLAICF